MSRRRNGVPTFTLLRLMGEVPSYTPAGRAVPHRSASTAAGFRRQIVSNVTETLSYLPQAHIRQI